MPPAARRCSRRGSPSRARCRAWRATTSSCRSQGSGRAAPCRPCRPRRRRRAAASRSRPETPLPRAASRGRRHRRWPQPRQGRDSASARRGAARPADASCRPTEALRQALPHGFAKRADRSRDPRPPTSPRRRWMPGSSCQARRRPARSWTGQQCGPPETRRRHRTWRGSAARGSRAPRRPPVRWADALPAPRCRWRATPRRDRHTPARCASSDRRRRLPRP